MSRITPCLWFDGKAEEAATFYVSLPKPSDPAVLPAGFRVDSNDARILTVALNLQREATDPDDVVLITKDMPLRVKAAAVGLTADEYRAELATAPGHTGMAELALSTAEVDALYNGETLDIPEARELPVHTGLVLLSDSGSALASSRLRSRLATPPAIAHSRSSPPTARMTSSCPEPCSG